MAIPAVVSMAAVPWSHDRLQPKSSSIETRPSQCPHSVTITLTCHISVVSCGTTATSPAAHTTPPDMSFPAAATPTWFCDT